MYKRIADVATSDAESSHNNRLKDLEKDVKDVDSTSDAELEDEIEEVVTLPASGAGSRRGSHSEASTTSHQDTTPKKIIRFKEGDPDNPDNWRQVHADWPCSCPGTDG
jgi:hypothetical protein